ncbi:nucleotide-binding alpha-beta plait domain-containing protein [Tanacetum coccineum]|uniref:Nucleotide-binding alpha-beta plait domain-containing protein n=1 Tax=Tanacetum coccineum TaxID=301880 RepID=A0ABQ5IWV7_9ASTR
MERGTLRLALACFQVQGLTVEASRQKRTSGPGRSQKRAKTLNNPFFGTIPVTFQPPQQPHQDQIQSAALVLPSDPISGKTSRDLWLSLEMAYAPHSTSREYTLKTQLLRIEMHGDETPDAYLNRAEEYADALAAIGEPVKDKDLVMLTVSGLREQYNGLKTTITACQSPTAFSELHALLSDHDYMLGKTRAPAPSITSSFVANYAVGSPSMLEARQTQLLELDCSTECSWIPSVTHFTIWSTSLLWCSPYQTTTRITITITVAIATTLVVTTTTEVVVMVINLIGHQYMCHVTPDLEVMDNSEAYYGDDTLHVGNSKGLPILYIGSSKVY